MKQDFSPSVQPPVEIFVRLVAVADLRPDFGDSLGGVVTEADEDGDALLLGAGREAA